MKLSARSDCASNQSVLNVLATGLFLDVLYLFSLLCCVCSHYPMCNNNVYLRSYAAMTVETRDMFVCRVNQKERGYLRKGLGWAYQQGLGIIWAILCFRTWESFGRFESKAVSFWFFSRQRNRKSMERDEGMSLRPAIIFSEPNSFALSSVDSLCGRWKPGAFQTR